MSRLRVLEVIDEGSVGGGQQHVLLLARGLNERGIEVAVACPAEGFLADQLDAVGVPRFPIRMYNRPDPAALAAMVRLCRAERFDLVHTHGGTAGLWGRLGARLAGVPARVHTFHGLHALHQRSRAWRGLLLAVERGLSRATSHVICVAASDLRLAAKAGLVPAGGGTVIRNGIDLARFAEQTDPSGRASVRTGLGLQENDFVIGTIGRLHRQKGHEFLVRAASSVVATHPESRFVIVGDGELREELRRLVKELGLERQVLLPGERTDVPGLLRAFDLFVLPSLWEGLPLVLIEDAAEWCAILATEVDGNLEILESGESALFVPPADPAGLANALLRLRAEASLRARLGEGARAAVLARFGADLMVEATLEVYRATIARTGRADRPAPIRR